MSRIKASIVAVLGLYLCGCQDSRSRDAIAVEPNDLGITELEVRHDVVQGERVLTLRGFDRGGATIATAALRTGTVLYGADMPEELHAGTELKVAVNDIDTSFISPDRVAHVIYEPLSPSIGTFVRLHAVASEIDREAGIRFAPPKAPSDEIAFTAGACSGSRFPTNKGGSTQCCQDTTNTYHVNASNAVANRFTYAPAYPTIPVCRKSDGTTGCTGSACLYGPCGSAVGQVAGTNGHVFHPTSNPNVCGWDTGGPGGLGVDYSPEHYTNQTLYGSLTPTCTCNGCNADGTPQCPTIARVNSTKVQAVNSASAATPALNVSSGNLVVVAISSYGESSNQVSSITDSAGNTFQYSGLFQALSGYHTGIQRLYYAYNSKANASDVVTVNMSQSAYFLDVVVAQYSGVLATSDPLDVTASAQAANTTSIASSSFTPSNTNSLVVGLMTVNWDPSASGPTSFTAGTGYSVSQTVGATLINAYEDRVDALASAQTAGGSESGATAPFQIGIIAAVFKPATAGGGGIARLNSTAVQRTDSTNAATPALAVSSGNLIVVAISTYGSTSNTVSSITDSAGNTFLNSGLSQTLNGFTGIQRLYYAYNTNAHASDVVTVTMSQQANFLDVVVAQYSGVLATSNPLDVTASAQAATTSITSSSFTPSNANSLVVALMTVNWTTTGPTSFAAGSGYSVAQTVGATLVDAYEDRINAPASAQTASGSESGAVTFQNGIIAAVFKPAGGGGGGGIARVNSTMVQRTNSTSAATPALAVSSGNLIVVAISTYGSTSNTVSSITDSAGNTFLNSGVSQTLSGFTGIQRLYYAYNSNANASDVVTVNVSQSASYLDVVVAQYSGVRKTSNPLDVTASAQASNTTSVTSSSFTPSLANSLAVALVTVNWTPSGPTSFAAGSGYSLNVTTGPTLIDAFEDRLSAPASAQTASGSESGATTPYQIGIIAVVFKPV